MVLNLNKTKGQVSVEYLLILVAAVLIVGVVITFLISTMQPVKESGTQQTYDYTCVTLQSKTFACACYTCDDTIIAYNDVTGLTEAPTIALCNDYADAKSAPLLSGTKCTSWT